MASSTRQRPLSSLRTALILLGCFRFSEAIAWTSIFPYVYFMAESFPDRGQSDPGFITGLLVATFTFCEFLSSSFWARVSEQIGRKPTLLIGASCGIITALSFGFSTTMWMAVLVRVLGGLTNPNIGVIQTCVGELVTVTADQGQKPPACDTTRLIPSSKSFLSCLIHPQLGVSVSLFRIQLAQISPEHCRALF